MTVPRLLPVIVACALPWTASRGAGETAFPLHAGWQDLALVNASDAQRVFATAQETNPASREARLGAALTLLQLRSHTPSHVADSAELLENLRRENPNDDVGIGAAYYLARIQQLITLPAIPLLGTGKTDYRTLNTQLKEQLAAAEKK